MALLIASAMLALLQYVVLVSGDEARQMLETELQNYDKCAKENNLSAEALDLITKKYQIADTKNAKCFAACHLLGMKMMNEKAIINWDRVEEVHRIEYTKPEDENKAVEVVKACRTTVQNGGDNCDAGYRALKCFLDNAKKLNLHMLGPEDLQ